MAKKIVFTFDIPLEKASFRVKVWRELRKIGARQEMRSYWSLPYTERNLADLKLVAKEIIKNDGQAEIVVGNVIYVT